MEQSLFLKVHGDTPKNRVWSFLIVHQEYDYSMKDIATFAGIGYTTIKSMWKDFVKLKLVVPTRQVGKAKMYKLNVSNPIVKKFVEFYWAVVDAEIDRNVQKVSAKSIVHTASAEVGVVSAKNF